MRAGRTLDRYLLREVTLAFLAGTGLAVSILFVLRIVEFVDLAFSRGVPASLVGSLAGYIVPSYLELALPMAALLAVVVVFARLGSEGELLAIRAAGVDMRALARPLWAFSISVAAISLVLGIWARPWANRGIEETTYEMARTRLTASLRAGVFNSWFGGVILFVDELDPASGFMRNVMLAEEREEYGRKTIFATEGVVDSDQEDRSAYLRLKSGSLLTYHATGRYHDKTDFDSLELHLDLAEESGLDRTDDGGPAAMSFERLLDARRERLARGERPVEESIELHRKFALPAAALLLPFVGLPLGAAGRRGVKSRGLLLSGAVVFLYYIALTVAVTVSREGMLPIAVAMWLPNVLLAALAVTLFRRAAAGHSLLPTLPVRPARPSPPAPSEGPRT